MTELDNHHRQLFEEEMKLSFKPSDNYDDLNYACNLPTSTYVAVILMGDPFYFDENCVYKDKWCVGTYCYKILGVIVLSDSDRIKCDGQVSAWHTDRHIEQQILSCEVVKFGMEKWRAKYGNKFSFVVCF